MKPLLLVVYPLHVESMTHELWGMRITKGGFNNV